MRRPHCWHCSGAPSRSVARRSHWATTSPALGATCSVSRVERAEFLPQVAPGMGRASRYVTLNSAKYEGFVGGEIQGWAHFRSITDPTVKVGATVAELLLLDLLDRHLQRPRLAK